MADQSQQAGAQNQQSSATPPQPVQQQGRNSYLCNIFRKGGVNTCVKIDLMTLIHNVCLFH